MNTKYYQTKLIKNKVEIIVIILALLAENWINRLQIMEKLTSALKVTHSKGVLKFLGDPTSYNTKVDISRLQEINVQTRKTLFHCVPWVFLCFPTFKSNIREKNWWISLWLSHNIIFTKQGLTIFNLQRHRSSTTSGNINRALTCLKVYNHIFQFEENMQHT